ncbi:MAG: glycosyltransferase [Anaerolineae bacterium]|nr:glycosyltransferase [Anaerolineae bacterium]
MVNHTPRSGSLDVLLISRCPPYPLHLGDRLIPYYLVRQLSGRGYQFDLLAFYQNPQDQADIPYYERYFRDIQLIEELPRSPASLLERQVLAPRRFPERLSESWSPQMWQAVARQLQQKRGYDVIHFFGGVHVYEFRALTRDHPTIIVPYESFSLYLERALAQGRSLPQKLVTRLQLMMARRYESWMYDGHRRVVVVSERDADVLRRLNPLLPLHVIPNGVDIEYFAPTGHDPDRPTLLFTGNYEYAPNVDAAQRLIRQIFPRVRQAVPEAELLIVGPHPPPSLRAQAGPGVQITGHVPDLRPYFEGATLYVSPLHIGAGIKNKILEALAMQTAVVATPLSCDGIAVTHGRDVVFALRTDEFVNQIVRLLKDPIARTRLALNGRRLIERLYTWRRVADAYEHLYHAVIREHSGE